jgi:para-nitrobenzyl esterase
MWWPRFINSLYGRRCEIAGEEPSIVPAISRIEAAFHRIKRLGLAALTGLITLPGAWAGNSSRAAESEPIVKLTAGELRGVLRPPSAVFAAGQEAGIPMIIGTTAREFPLTLSAEKLRTIIQKNYGNIAPKAVKAYGIAGNAEGTNDPLFGPPSAQWSADTQFRCPATSQAIWHNAAHQPVYEYQLERTIPGHESEGAAVHSGDLVYVFGYYPKTGNIGGVFGEPDYKLADMMEKYWTNFAKTGNPNAKGLPEWPEFDGSQAYIEFTQDVQVVTKTGLRREQCDMFRENLKRLIAQ